MPASRPARGREAWSGRSQDPGYLHQWRPVPSLSQGDQLTALPRITSSCPVTVPGLSQSPPQETPALQLGHGELPHQGGGAVDEVQEEEGQGADPQTV